MTQSINSNKKKISQTMWTTPGKLLLTVFMTLILIQRHYCDAYCDPHLECFISYTQIMTSFGSKCHHLSKRSSPHFYGQLDIEKMIEGSWKPLQYIAHLKLQKDQIQGGVDKNPFVIFKFSNLMEVCFSFSKWWWKWKWWRCYLPNSGISFGTRNH